MDEDIIPARLVDSEPAYQLTVEIEEGYIRAHVSGQRTRAAVSSIVSEVARAAIEHKLDKVLIDSKELEGWLSVFDSYQVITQDFSRFRGKGIAKVAIVDRPLPNLPEWFFETLARNRGYNLRIFETRVLALDWLLSPGTDDENRNRSES